MLILYEKTLYHPTPMLHRVENGRKCKSRGVTLLCLIACLKSAPFNARSIHGHWGKVERPKHTENEQKIVIFD